MKRIASLSCIVLLLLVPWLFLVNNADAQETPALFSAERFVIAGSIDNREPVGIVNVFPSSTEKVYCFLEAADISQDTQATFVWSHDGNEVAKVDLPLRQGKRWRTYSSKKLGGRTGAWKVELQDANGSILKTVEFSVE